MPYVPADALYWCLVQNSRGIFNLLSILTVLLLFILLITITGCCIIVIQSFNFFFFFFKVCIKRDSVFNKMLTRDDGICDTKSMIGFLAS